MKQVLFAAAILSLIATTAQADCQEEIDNAYAAFEASDVGEEKQGMIADALDAATEKVTAGDEKACMAELAKATKLLEAQ